MLIFVLGFCFFIARVHARASYEVDMLDLTLAEDTGRENKRSFGSLRGYPRTGDANVYDDDGSAVACKSWRQPARPWGDKWGNHLNQYEPKTDQEKFWTELKPTPEQVRPTKIALLMFVKDRVNNAAVWSSWMEDATSHGLDFKLLIHAWKNHTHKDKKHHKHNDRKNKTRGGFEPATFRKYLVPEQARTTWNDIVEAEIMLLRYALRDLDVTHVATISDDTVPVKPLSYIYQELLREPATRMCVDLKSGESGDQKTHAETWWLMKRSDAQRFSDHWKLVQQSFVERSTEEKTWLLPLILRYKRWRDESRLLDECVMYTDWADDCNHWRDHEALCDCPHLRQEPHQPGLLSSPRLHYQLGSQAWSELRASPFWWARKFSDMPVEKQLVLLQTPWTANPQMK